MRFLFDATSMLLRRRIPVMTGIDRVEFAIADALLGAARRGAATVDFLLATPAGKWVISSDVMALQLCAIVKQRGLDARPGPLLDAVFAALAADGPPRAPGARLATRQSMPSKMRRVIDLGFLIARHAVPLDRHLARVGTLHYIHASHRGFARPREFDWLARQEVDATFFIHDLIPLDFPVFCGDGARRNAHAGLSVLARFADRIATPSWYAAERLQYWLSESKLPQPPIAVRRLGAGRLVAPNPGYSRDVNRNLAPFWLCIGTIEGRKNIGALLSLWRSAARARGGLPRLVLAGARGWRNDAVLAALDTDATLAPHILEVEGLNDVELAILIGHARGVVTPSLVEGFSLAPAEAAALQRPAIVSAIPAHLELVAESPLVRVMDADWRPEAPLPSPAGAAEYRSWEAFGSAFVAWLEAEGAGTRRSAVLGS